MRGQRSGDRDEGSRELVARGSWLVTRGSWLVARDSWLVARCSFPPATSHKSSVTNKSPDTRHHTPDTSHCLLFTIYYLLFTLLVGCGPDHQLKRAEKLIEKEQHLDAAVSLERFYNKYPTHKLAPRAILKSAGIYNYKMRLPSKAASLYKTVLASYGDFADYAAEAMRGLLKSPDYFPLVHGASWLEGDSASGGTNMRAEWKVLEVSTGVFELSKKFMAAGKIVTKKKSFFKHEKFALIESPAIKSSIAWIFLEYPLNPGKKWSSVRAGKNVIFSIDSATNRVETRAGVFDDCLKISERYHDMPGVVKYNYYAPYVGWVLTTISTGKVEHRNSELISYKIPL